MANPSSDQSPPIPSSQHASLATFSKSQTVGNGDARVPLLNLSTVRLRMDSVQQFLSDSISYNNIVKKDQMDLISNEIESALHQIIINGAALLACARTSSSTSTQAPAPDNSPFGRSHD